MIYPSLQCTHKEAPMLQIHTPVIYVHAYIAQLESPLRLQPSESLLVGLDKHFRVSLGCFIYFCRPENVIPNICKEKITH